MEQITNNGTHQDFPLNENASNLSSEVYDESEYFVPQSIIYSYFVFIALGSAINLIHCLALVRCRRNGTLSLIMQLSAVDALSPYVAAVEILTLSKQTWFFSSENCPIFNGVEILVNSLTLWFVICLNFHVISLWNLHKNEIEKKNKNPLTSCQDESNECLVTKKENANRTLNIDYRKRKNDISVIIPTILIWFFCVSLSIPNFTLSSTLKINGSHTICAIVDHFYGHILQRLLLTFRVLLPIPLLIFALVVLLLKLTKTSHENIDNILTKKFYEIRGLLIFCISLTSLYIVTSFQRNLLRFLHLLSHDFDKSTAVIFKVPPLYINKLNHSDSIYLAMLHYSGNTFRVILYLYLLPKFRDLAKSKIFVCCKTEK